MSHKASVLWLNNSHVVQLSGLRNGLSDEFANAATVVATLKNSNGAEVAGQAWPVTLAYVANSNGNYNVVLPPNLNLKKSVRYQLSISATSNGLTANWTQYIQAKVR